MTALCTHVCVCLLVLFVWTDHLTVNLKYFTIECPHRCVLQLSCENEREGLLPDYRVGAKENKSEVQCIGSTKDNLLSDKTMV